MAKIAVVGAGGGIGLYLADHFDAVPFVRGDSLERLAGAETIIFCAAKARFETPQADIFAALEDNLLLLERVSRVAHQRFIYFSTVDVYDPSAKAQHEDATISLESVRSGYPAFKLLGEAIVRERCRKPLILRPTSLFGPGMRPNNIVRVLRGDVDGVTLTGNSTFNCVTYEMIAALIDRALQEGYVGTVNCAASSDVALLEVAEMSAYSGGFGEHHYKAPSLDNRRAAEMVPAFQKSSLEILRAFYDTRGQ